MPDVDDDDLPDDAEPLEDDLDLDETDDDEDDLDQDEFDEDDDLDEEDLDGEGLDEDELGDLDVDEDDDPLAEDIEEAAGYDARSGLERLVRRGAGHAPPPGADLEPASDGDDAYGAPIKPEEIAVKDEDQTVSTKEEGSRDWEERSYGADAEETLLEGAQGLEGSGATAEDVEDESDPHEDELLDEGLEETFPASDPVSAKHIT